VAIPKYTKGKLPLQANKKDGQPLNSKVEALDDPRSDTPDLLPRRARWTIAVSPP
jgi:hypothetical protein